MDDIVSQEKLNRLMILAKYEFLKNDLDWENEETRENLVAAMARKLNGNGIRASIQDGYIVISPPQGQARPEDDKAMIISPDGFVSHKVLNEYLAHSELLNDTIHG
jgi:hypothetical protein